MAAIFRGILVVALTLLKMPTARPAPTTNEFQIQTTVVVDRKGFENWKTVSGKSTFDELKKEIESNMVDVTDIYKSLQRFDPPLTITFEIVDIQLLSNWFGRETVDIINALDTLQSWTIKQTHTFDLALFYTGFDLVRSGNSEHGVAWIEGICTNKSLAILELFGTPKDPLTIAHEIGHSLGAQHDGQALGNECNPRDGFNMANIIYIDKANHFRFSSCSYNYIYNHLVKNGHGQCLLDGDPSNRVKGLKGGEILTPDVQCQRRFGKGSVADRGHYAYKDQPESVCTQLRCVPSSRTEKYVTSGDGMTCGKNKQCIQGRCIQTSKGDPTALDACPLGDQTTPLNNKGLTCDTLPEAACFQWKPQCCQKCANYEVSEADAACKRLKGPNSLLLRSKYEKGWGDSLCQKLYCESDYFYSAEEFDTPEGMKCGQNKVCKNKKCVEAPNGNPAMPDECPYGDRPWIKTYDTDCTGFVARYGCSWRAKAMCCVSCPPTLDVKHITKTHDEVCQSGKGYGWAFARGVYQKYGDNLCSRPLQCVKAVTEDDGAKRLIRAEIPVPKGLTCGRSKVCVDGRCRESSQGYPYARDNCPAGDQPLMTIGYTPDLNKCAHQPDRNNFCKENKQWCCETCQ